MPWYICRRSFVTNCIKNLYLVYIVFGSIRYCHKTFLSSLAFSCNTSLLLLIFLYKKNYTFLEWKNLLATFLNGWLWSSCLPFIRTVGSFQYRYFLVQNYNGIDLFKLLLLPRNYPILTRGVHTQYIINFSQQVVSVRMLKI